jgi:hypothetical protein
MRNGRLTYSTVTHCLALLIVAGFSAVPAPALDVAGPTPEEAAVIEKFEALWETLGRETKVNSIEYRELIHQATECVNAMGTFGPVGHRVLIEHLRRPAVRLKTDQGFPHSVYTEMKIVIIDVLAENDVAEATPALIAIVAPSHLLIKEPPPPREPHSLTGKQDPCRRRQMVKPHSAKRRDRRAKPPRRVTTVARPENLQLSSEPPEIRISPAMFNRLRYERLAPPAVRALGRLGDPSAIPVLREAFTVVWENLSYGAAFFTDVPEALIALDDGEYIADYILPYLTDEDPKMAFQAAYLAQKLRDGKSLIPHLIESFRKSNDQIVCCALDRITGQPYIDVTSWDEWWELNRDWPRDEWIPLEADAGRTERWQRSLIELIEKKYLSRNPLGWWRPCGPGAADWKEVSLHVAAKVHRLDVAQPVTAYLEERLEDESLTSGTGPLPGSYSRGVRGGRGPVCEGDEPAPSKPHHSAFDVPISTNARKLLAAIACTGSAARCGEWDELAAIPGILGVYFQSEDRE